VCMCVIYYIHTHTHARTHAHTHTHYIHTPSLSPLPPLSLSHTHTTCESSKRPVGASWFKSNSRTPRISSSFDRSNKASRCAREPMPGTHITAKCSMLTCVCVCERAIQRESACAHTHNHRPRTHHMHMYHAKVCNGPGQSCGSSVIKFGLQTQRMKK